MLDALDKNGVIVNNVNEQPREILPTIYRIEL